MTTVAGGRATVDAYVAALIARQPYADFGDRPGAECKPAASPGARPGLRAEGQTPEGSASLRGGRFSCLAI